MLKSGTHISRATVKIIEQMLARVAMIWDVLLIVLAECTSHTCVSSMTCDGKGATGQNSQLKLAVPPVANTPLGPASEVPVARALVRAASTPSRILLILSSLGGLLMVRPLL